MYMRVCLYITCCPFVYRWARGLFRALALGKSAAMNNGWGCSRRTRPCSSPSIFPARTLWGALAPHMAVGDAVFESLKQHRPEAGQQRHFASPPALCRNSSFSTPSPMLGTFLNRLFGGWICISLMTNDVEHLLMCLLAIYLYIARECLLKSAHCWVGLCVNLVCFWHSPSGLWLVQTGLGAERSTDGTGARSTDSAG